MLMLKLAWRSLWRNRRRTLITTSSITFGLTFALFVISMGNGMYKKLIDDAVKMNAGHVTVQHAAYGEAPSVDLFVPSIERVRRAAAAIEGVERVKPLIVTQAVVSSGSGSAGVGLTGVLPEIEADISPLATNIVAGHYLEAGDTRGVILGTTLAKRLKLAPGKKLVLTTNDIHGELVSEMLRVRGIFTVGTEEADGFLIQVPLAVAQRILHHGPDEATQVGLLLAAPAYQQRVRAALQARLAGDDLAVLPWQEVLPDLAGFMAVDLGANYIFQGIIIFLICFTILNTILMSVLERTREFATQLALGTPPQLLRLQIMIESALIGLLGTASGLLLGGGISGYFQVKGLDFSALFSDDLSVSGFAVDPIIHNEVTPFLLGWTGALVFGLTVVIGLYPAWKSAHIDLPDVLRSR